MGERTPHLDPDVRGAFVGLSAMHTRSDMTRAVLEGVSYSLTDCMSVLREMDVNPTVMRVCGGGGRSPMWRQMLADMFGIPTAVTTAEGPALGVAILAMVGAGIYPTVSDACKKIITLKDEFAPDMTANAGYQPYYGIYKKLYGDLRETYKMMAKL
jgi:xylulokinase